MDKARSVRIPWVKRFFMFDGYFGDLSVFSLTDRNVALRSRENVETWLSLSLSLKFFTNKMDINAGSVESKQLIQSNCRKFFWSYVDILQKIRRGTRSSYIGNIGVNEELHDYVKVVVFIIKLEPVVIFFCCLISFILYSFPYLLWIGLPSSPLTLVDVYSSWCSTTLMHCAIVYFSFSLLFHDEIFYSHGNRLQSNWCQTC